MPGPENSLYSRSYLIKFQNLCPHLQPVEERDGFCRAGCFAPVVPQYQLIGEVPKFDERTEEELPGTHVKVYLVFVCEPDAYCNMISRRNAIPDETTCPRGRAVTNACFLPDEIVISEKEYRQGPGRFRLL